MIKISVPNDDSAALFHLGKSLIDLSSTVEGSPYWVVITQEEYNSLKAGENMDVGPVKVRAYNVSIEGLSEIRPVPEYMLRGGCKQAEPDTTSQQVESLAIPVEANGATDLGSDNAQALPVADSTDTPWDERIHSASKALNADGTWRLRRKPKDMEDIDWLAFVNGVKDQLNGIVQTDEEDAEDVVNIEPTVTPAGDDFHVDAGVVTEEQVADIPPPPPVPVVVADLTMNIDVPNPPHTIPFNAQVTMTFPQVMAYLTERHGRISNAQVEQIIAEMGLKSIMDLNTQPEHTGPFIARVKVLLGE